MADRIYRIDLIDKIDWIICFCLSPGKAEKTILFILFILSDVYPVGLDLGEKRLT
ncbi:MAG: hypothetical protein HWN69_07360 [Desulfobacterales bacterium]|nr:hypothetical protein [Desulfobacterales bacterium]